VTFMSVRAMPFSSHWLFAHRKRARSRTESQTSSKPLVPSSSAGASLAAETHASSLATTQCSTSLDSWSRDSFSDDGTGTTMEASVERVSFHGAVEVKPRTCRNCAADLVRLDRLDPESSSPPSARSGICRCGELGCRSRCGEGPGPTNLSFIPLPLVGRALNRAMSVELCEDTHHYCSPECRWSYRHREEQTMLTHIQQAAQAKGQLGPVRPADKPPAKQSPGFITTQLG